MTAALETAAHLPTQGRRFAVLADMLELGRSSERFHREIGEYAGTCKFDALICVGPQSKLIMEAAVTSGMEADRVSHYADSVQAAADVPRWLDAGDLVLLKGSRGMRLERVANAIADFRAPDLTRWSA
jgi:UDP-N-acetylmuramoyl-tripeptide--D-alanyl-D-alanine ligase